MEDANRLLASLRPDAKAVGTVSELQGIATSLFIAVFESLFVVRLKDVVREPITQQEFLQNAATFLHGLRKLLPNGVVQIPPEITPEAVTAGSIPVIAYLVRFFLELQRLFGESDQDAHAGARRHGARVPSFTHKRSASVPRKAKPSPGKGRREGSVPRRAATRAEPPQGTPTPSSSFPPSAASSVNGDAPEAKAAESSEGSIGSLGGVAEEAMRAAAARARQQAVDARLTRARQEEAKRALLTAQLINLKQLDASRRVVRAQQVWVWLFVSVCVGLCIGLRLPTSWVSFTLCYDAFAGGVCVIGDGEVHGCSPAARQSGCSGQENH